MPTTSKLPDGTEVLRVEYDGCCAFWGFVATRRDPEGTTVLLTRLDCG